LLVKHLGAIPEYQVAFRKVFGTDLNPDGVAKAIAAYERTILSGNSPYDRFRAGERTALSASALRGLALFEGNAHCMSCHEGFNFTDESYHNLGVSMDRPNPDLGRYTVTQREEHKGAFKTPTLRDVARHPPYMHDGSVRSLAEVIALYNRGGTPNPWLSGEIRPLGLTLDEQADLMAFLGALTGEIAAEVSSSPSTVTAPASERDTLDVDDSPSLPDHLRPLACRGHAGSAAERRDQLGLHDHVAGADGDQDAGHLQRSGSNGVHTGHHHCEFSMNPGHTCRLRDSGVPPTITALAVSNPARFVALPPAAPVPPPRS
jgi:hypothetical protein